MKFVYSSRVLRPLNGAEPKHDRSHVALIAQLVEHCTGNAKVVGSNPVQSLNFFSGHFSSNVMAAFASFILTLSVDWFIGYFIACVRYGSPG